MKLQIELTGIGPALQHNGRLANPLDPLTVELRSWTSKRKPTDEDRVRVAQLEARAGLYETADGYVGWPSENVWRSIYDAATAYRLGAEIKRALIDDATVEPLTIDGELVPADEFFDVDGRLLYVSAKNPTGKTRVMRARPLITNWQSKHTFELLDDVLDLANLTPVFERAGRLVGIGDWRPKYGKYHLEVLP